MIVSVLGSLVVLYVLVMVSPAILRLLPRETERRLMWPIRSSRRRLDFYNKVIFRPHCKYRSKLLAWQLDEVLRRQCIAVRLDNESIEALVPSVKVCSEIPEVKSDEIRVVLVSDTHNQHNRLRQTPDGDILIHAGDILRGSNRRTDNVARLRSFARWIQAQPQRHKLVIAGNHDAFLEGMSLKEIRAYLGPTVQYCLDELVTIENITIVLSPYSTSNSVRSSNRAFQSDLRRDAFLSALKKSNKKIDILVTHGPPLGVLDCGVGSTAIAKAVAEYSPRFHIFGHQHNAFGLATDQNTVFINATSCDGLFAMTRPPIVLDLTPSSQKVSSKIHHNTLPSALIPIRLNYWRPAIVLEPIRFYCDEQGHALGLLNYSAKSSEHCRYRQHHKNGATRLHHTHNGAISSRKERRSPTRASLRSLFTNFRSTDIY